MRTKNVKDKQVKKPIVISASDDSIFTTDFALNISAKDGTDEEPLGPTPPPKKK